MRQRRKDVRSNQDWAKKEGVWSLATGLLSSGEAATAFSQK